MPRNINQIGYGKISITSDEPLEKLVEILGKLLRDHGYPEEEKKAERKKIMELEEDFKQAMEEDETPVEKLVQTKTRK
jgi:hypothetical protein